jgi:hypothetical protein
MAAKLSQKEGSQQIMVRNLAIGTIVLFLLGSAVILNAGTVCRKVMVYAGNDTKNPEATWMYYCSNVVSYECQENKEFYIKQAKALPAPCPIGDMTLRLESLI